MPSVEQLPHGHAFWHLPSGGKGALQNWVPTTRVQHVKWGSGRLCMYTRGLVSGHVLRCYPLTGLHCCATVPLLKVMAPLSEKKVVGMLR